MEISQFYAVFQKPPVFLVRTYGNRNVDASHVTCSVQVVRSLLAGGVRVRVHYGATNFVFKVG